MPGESGRGSSAAAGGIKERESEGPRSDVREPLGDACEPLDARLLRAHAAPSDERRLIALPFARAQLATPVHPRRPLLLDMRLRCNNVDISF